MAKARQPDGLLLPLAAAAWIGLLFGGLVIGVALGGVMPLPYGPAAAVQQYVRAQPLAIRVIAVTAFASSLPLVLYAATASARLRRLGVTTAGPTIALAGGTLAAGTLGLTGLLGWTLSRPEISADVASARALYVLAFLIGGVGHVAALGLLVAGVAVPGLALGLLPRPLARIGLAIATLCAVTTFVLAWTALGPILPVARVTAMCWLLVVGARLGPRRNVSPAHT
jgi:hypothetical protein